jgi:O-antigen/teichoic acid export membrane protein
MEEIRVVSKNSLMIALREMILRLTGLITFPLIARSIGVSVLGILGVAQAVSGILFLVADLGLNKSLVKEVAQNKSEEDSIFSNAFVLKAVSLAAAVGVGLILVDLFTLDAFSKKLTIAVLFLGFFTGIQDLISSLFSAHEKMEFLPFVEGLSKASLLIGAVVIFLVLKGTIIHLQLYSILVTVGIILLSLRLFVKKIKRIKFRVKPDLMPNLLRMSIPFMMVGFFSQTFGSIDSLMLASMLGRDAVGMYQIAYRIITFLHFAPATVSAALFPTLSRLYVEDYPKFELGLKRCFKYLLLLSILSATTLNVLAPFIIRTVFGQAYEGSIPLLQLLAWSMVFIFITFPLGVSLGVSGNQKDNVCAAVLGSAGNIVMNYAFIRLSGIDGVAISTVLTAVLVGATSFYFFKRRFRRIEFFEPLPSILLLATPLTAFLDINPVAKIVAFYSCFFSVVFLTKVLDKRDWRTFLRILRIESAFE